MDHLLTENIISLTTMENGGPGYEAKYAYTDRLFQSEYHCHDFYEFYIHLRGGQYFVLDDRLYFLQPNQLFILPPFSMHGRSCESELKGYERAYLNVSPELMKLLGFQLLDLEGFFRSYTSRGQNIFLLGPDGASRCTEWIRALQEAKRSENEMANYACYCILVNFLNEVCQTMCRSRPVTANVANKTVIQDVLTYINGNYTQQLKMSDIAKRFGISVSYLSHEFVKFTNHSVYDYILYRRIVLARQMIKTDAALNTIAYQCGFNDYSNFTRVFNRLVGMPPSRYRKQLRLSRGMR